MRNVVLTINISKNLAYFIVQKVQTPFHKVQTFFPIFSKQNLLIILFLEMLKPGPNHRNRVELDLIGGPRQLRRQLLKLSGGGLLKLSILAAKRRREKICQREVGLNDGIMIIP